jgi:LAO/AO transport system kinase
VATYTSEIGTPDDASGLAALRAGGKPALARALAGLERAPESEATLALLDAAHAGARAHVVGLTGPPGVGKSTLLSALIRQYRASGRSVGVIAVDPSSRRSGGALLGDRVRLLSDPRDSGLFVRSMAARDRLGGLAELTMAAMVVMRAVFDVVLIETVGVGQSETDVAGAADTVVFCVQPGSGDSLQFMKAGIVEIPDVAIVTKADMGVPAERALSDLNGALSLNQAATDAWAVRTLAVSAESGEGVADLVAALDTHNAWLDGEGRRTALRQHQAETWLREAVRDRYGRDGLKRAPDLTLAPTVSPFARLAELVATLDRP